MKNKLIKLMDKYGNIFIILCILVCVAGLVWSYVKPRTTLDTYEINMKENNDYNIVLKLDVEVEYHCNTGELPLNGVQMGISKEGHEYTDGQVVCSVFKADDNTLLGVTKQNLNEIVELQYVYFPFMAMTQYAGEVVIKFTYEGSDTEYPAIVANETVVDEITTYVNGEKIDGCLKAYHLYSRDIYPYVFDLKVFLIIFITVFFTLSFGKKNRQKAD